MSTVDTLHVRLRCRHPVTPRELVLTQDGPDPVALWVRRARNESDGAAGPVPRLGRRVRAMVTPPIDTPAATAGPRRVRTPWHRGVVLVCRECDGAKGFGPKKVRATLKAAVKATLPKRAVRVLAVDCLDVCPKRAVTVAMLGASHATVIVRQRDECAALLAGLGDATTL